MERRPLALFLALTLLVNAFCLPSVPRPKRNSDLGVETNSVYSNETDKDNTALATHQEENNLDDEIFDEDFNKNTSGGGGSNLMSLLNIANAILPSLSGANAKKNNEVVTKVIKEIMKRYQKKVIRKRKDIEDNVIEIDYVSELTPPVFERQETEEQSSESTESHSSDSEEDNGEEQSIEKTSNENGGSESKEDSASNASNASNGNADSDSDNDDNDSDYDEPEGDEQGGGILGLLAGLSGDGDSDLGSLLAAVGGIVANLSGDGVDVNALIASGLGLFVGLLSDEGTNPGEVLASYLLTSLDTISGGGAQNNGAFFGKFLSSLVKGVSGGGDTSASSEENGNGGNNMADSAGFFASLLMGLLVRSRSEIPIPSKPANAEQPPSPTSSPFWLFKMDIIGAVMRLGLRIMSLASSGSFGISTPTVN